MNMYFISNLKNEMKKIPPLIKIARNIDIYYLNNIKKITRKVAIIPIVRIEKMSQNNYSELYPFNNHDYDYIVTDYRCDVCNTTTSDKNPIYTNSKYEGCDICEQCLSKVFNNDNFKEIPGWHPGPVYSLENIYISIKGDSEIDSESNSIHKCTNKCTHK